MNACKGRMPVLRAVGLLVLLLSLVTGAAATGSSSVLGWYVARDTVSVYVRGSGLMTSVQARVGTESAGSAVLTGTDGSIPVTTWLLVDNSLSISEADRAGSKQLLADLVAGRAAEEQFNLCTFSTSLNVLLKDSRSYTDLKSRIDGITYNNQYAYLIDALAAILDEVDAQDRQEYVRIVVISDGVDINPGGLTREELLLRLRKRNVPIYTLGCWSNDNEQSLKEMYALSRLTNAKNWSLSDMESSLSVVQEMAGTELPVCATVTIPEELRDGTERGVQVTFDDGTVAEFSATMPFGDKPPSPPPSPASPSPSPSPAASQEPEPAGESVLKLPVLIAAAVALAAAVGAAAFFLLRKMREREQIKPVIEARSGPEPTEFVVMSEGGTAILVNNSYRLMLNLADVASPGRHFEAPLDPSKEVSVGRGQGNRIVLDYDRSVSSEHCEIYLEGTSIRIRDLNSSNGTYVDGNRVVGDAEIFNGSIIKLGRIELKVEVRRV